MKSIAWITLYSAVLFGMASCGKEAKGPLATVEQAVYDGKISGWPDSSKEVAKQIIDKYGAPNESTDSMLIWYDHANTYWWKKTVVYRDGVEHRFPKPHEDILRQTIDFKVPLMKAADLLAFYGSLTIDRTKGELSARSEREEMNLLAFNLAFDIMSDKKSVEAARKALNKGAWDLANGKPSEYSEALKFQIPKGTADPDEVYKKKAKAKPATIVPMESSKLDTPPKAEKKPF